MDVRIPHVEMTEGTSADDQPEIQLDDDPEVAAALDTTNVPLIITVAQVLVMTTAPAVLVILLDVASAGCWKAAGQRPFLPAAMLVRRKSRA